jgi:hypothetical protein
VQFERSSPIFALLAASFLVAGCASNTAPDYSKVEQAGHLAPPRHRAVVIIYARAGPSTFATANDKPLCVLWPNTFYSYVSRPGLLRLGCGNRFDTSSYPLLDSPVLPSGDISGTFRDYISLDVRPAATYYVKMTTHPRPTLQLVPASRAEVDLSHCWWMNAISY